MQRAQFVAAMDLRRRAEVAGGDALDVGQGGTQRQDDLAGDQPGGQGAERQCQQRADDQAGAGFAAFDVQTFKLELIQGIAQPDDFFLLVGHLLACLGDGLGRADEGFNGASVVTQHRADLLNGVAAGLIELAAMLLQCRYRGVELCVDGLDVVRGGGGQVDAQQVARVLDVVTHLRDDAVLLEALRLVVGQLQGALVERTGQAVQLDGCGVHGPL